MQLRRVTLNVVFARGALGRRVTPIDDGCNIEHAFFKQVVLQVVERMDHGDSEI